MPVSVRIHLQVLSVAAAIVLAIPGAATGQNAQQAPCSAPEYRHFDFWVGDWEVRNAAGNLAGTNSITPMLNGCVLHEQWSGSSGSVGESFNIYDQSTGTWHQTWVDNGGLLLRLDGGLEGDSMVLRGELQGRDGAMRQHRITWTPRDDGSVRQHWENSTDGESWNTLFDGTYRPRDASD